MTDDFDESWRATIKRLLFGYDDGNDSHDPAIPMDEETPDPPECISINHDAIGVGNALQIDKHGDATVIIHGDRDVVRPFDGLAKAAAAIQDRNPNDPANWVACAECGAHDVDMVSSAVRDTHNTTDFLCHNCGARSFREWSGQGRSRR
jgi:hypothetical protein